MAGNDRYVKPTGVNSDTGVDMAHAWATIPYAITNITAPGDIIVENGAVFSGPAQLGAAKSALVTVRPETSVAQYTHGYELAASGSDVHELLASTNLTFKNAKFSVGTTPAVPTPLWSNAVALTAVRFEDSIFVCAGVEGGPQVVASGDLTFKRCIFQNAAGGSGSNYFGLYCYGSGSGLALAVEECKFDNPKERNFGAWGTLTSVRFRGNTTDPYGTPGRGCTIGAAGEATNVISNVIVEGNTFDGETVTTSPWIGVAVPLRTYNINGLVCHDNCFINGFDNFHLNGVTGADIGHNFFLMNFRGSEAMHFLGCREVCFHDNDIWAIGGIEGTQSFALLMGLNSVTSAKLGNLSVVRNVIHTRNVTGAYYIPGVLANTLESGKYLHIDRNVYDIQGTYPSNIFGTTVASDTLTNIRTAWSAAGLPTYNGTNSDCDRRSVEWDAAYVQPGVPNVAPGSAGGLALYSSPVYFAGVDFTLDQANIKDEYTATWFKDTTFISTVTTPMIHVVRRSTGLTLVASSYMTQVGTTGRYKYDAVTTERSSRGDALCITVFGTIDGALRVCPVTRSRDS